MLILPAMLFFARQVPDPTARVVAGMCAFSKSLVTALPDEAGKNVVASPFSVGSCLALLLPGVDKGDAAMLSKALHVPADVEVASEGFKGLNGQLSGSPSSEFVIANSVWTGPRYTLAPAYVGKVADSFDAEARVLSDAGRSGVKEVNTWIAQKTKGRITNLLQQLAPTTALVLVNAVSFDGVWAHAFSSTRTAEKPFHALGGIKNVPMMTQTETTRYGKGEGYQAIELDYVSGGFSMVVYLPDPGGDPMTLLRSLDFAALPEMDATRVDLELPKFKFNSRFDLMGSLKALGLGSLAQHIDAHAMLQTPESMRLSQLLHAAEIEVDERGTRAAAATVGVVTRAAILAPPRKAEFHVDRPFAFVIRHALSGTPLFVGAVYEP